MKSPKVLCALSGGVDSSVAAALLHEAGCDVVGVFMRNGVSADEAPGAKGSCCSASDARDASRVAEKLGIPFYAIAFEAEFGQIIENFVDEYRLGRTPSPCVLCNQDLKFGHLFELANALGCEQIATGHYARMQGDHLLRPTDLVKDQTYFLFGVDRAYLPRLLFPLGEMTKAQVREVAARFGFSNANKPESMDICFVPGGDYRELLRARGPLHAGNFVNSDGELLGKHEGFENFTVGQRRGLPALGTPHYVLEIRPDSGDVVLGEREELAVFRCEVDGLRWLIEPPEEGHGMSCCVQIRARHEAAPAQLRVGAKFVQVEFDDPQEAVTPGQAAVFYEGDRLLGGGWIRLCADQGIADQGIADQGIAD